MADGILLQVPLVPEKRRLRSFRQANPEGVEALRRLAEQMPQRAGKAVVQIPELPAELS